MLLGERSSDWSKGVVMSCCYSSDGMSKFCRTTFLFLNGCSFDFVEERTRIGSGMK